MLMLCVLLEAVFRSLVAVENLDYAAQASLFENEPIVSDIDFTPAEFGARYILSWSPHCAKGLLPSLHEGLGGFGESRPSFSSLPLTSRFSFSLSVRCCALLCDKVSSVLALHPSLPL